MAKTIKEMADAYGYVCRDGLGFRKMDCIKAYEDGANAVLERIETYIQNLDLGNSAEEKFYKLDVIDDIGLYIKELKGE